MSEPRSFMPLLLVILLAFVVPLALSRVKRLRLPIVVGEILAGIVVGRSGLNWVQSYDAILDLLAEFGFVFLMFLAGMEIDFSSLGALGSTGASPKKRSWRPVTLGGLTFVLTLAFSTAVGFGLTSLGLVRNPWMTALILSTTSLGVVMPVLKEQNLSTGQFGQSLLIAALIADFATMLLITVVVAALSRGITPDILLIGVLFVAFFLVYHFGMLFFNRIKAVRLAIEELSHTTARIKVRAAFTMMLIFVALSQVLGTEVILGAFLAGVIVSLLRTPDDTELTHQLDAIGFGFFIPIFFITVGVRFNLGALFASSEALLLVPVLLVAAIGVKLIPALVFRLSFSWRESLAAGALLSARLSLIIAASAIGLRLGVISESVNTSIILIAILTVTAAPMVFVRLAPRPEAGVARPMIVVGAGELGLQVAEQLLAHHEAVVVIDPDESRVARARKHGLEAVTAQVERNDPAAAPYLEKAQAVICTLTETGLSYRICEVARRTYGIDHVVAQVNEPNELLRFEQLGVRPMHVGMDRAALFVLLARNPAAYGLLTRTDDDKEVTEVVVSNEDYASKTLRQLTLPGDVLVLAVRRNGELLVPHGNTQLSWGDHVTLAGSLEHIETARQMLAHTDA
jgi:Kef-type K+ transport system membrane component KefB/Trk K+ transport system NAD-binding subunit